MRTVLSLVILLGCVMFAGAQGPPATPVPTLAPGDVVQVIVFGYHPYGGDFEVFDDGTINGQGFGRIKAEGLTLAALESTISTALKGSLKDPTVRLVLKAKKRQVVYVLSLGAQQEGGSPAAFRQAGAIQIMPGMTLRQLIAAVTVPGEPDLLDATLHRKDGSRIDVDLLKLVRGDEGQWNGLIEADDTLTILPKPYIRVWLMGHVHTPGEVRIRQGSDLYQALADNGGVEKSSDLVDELTLTLRRGPNVESFPVRTDGAKGPILEAGDVVTVEVPKQIRVVIGGEITAPGEYLVPAGSQIGRLVAEARGASVEGTLSHVLVMRGSEVFKLDATGPIKGGADSSFTLAADDFVYVMRSERAVYATGQINSAGRYLIPDGKEWTATDLLTQAKGLGSRGTLRRVTLLRPDSTGKIVAQRFNLDEFLKDGRVESNPTLQPGDVLYFGEPKGLTTSAFPLVSQAAFYLDAIFKGN